MAGCDRGHQRELFGAWLIRQINNKSYGLSWLDEGKTTFAIPWKHLSRKDLTGQDYELFKAWAKHGGKYSEQHEDRSTWKTNFRCALNSISVKEKKMSSEAQDGASMKDKKIFIEVEDKSGDSNKPHKVYRLIQVPEVANHVSTPSFADPSGPPYSDEDEDELRISPDYLQNPDFKRVLPPQDQSSIEDILTILSLESQDAETIPLGQHGALNGPCEQIGYPGDEANLVCSMTVSQQNGYHRKHYDALQWCQTETAAPVSNGCIFQDQKSVPLTVLHSPQEIKASFQSQNSLQNGYAHVLQQQCNGFNYSTRNSPVENSYRSGAEWTSPAGAEYSPIQNGYISPTCQHENSPQHQLPRLPVANQYLNSPIQNGYISPAFQQNSPQHQHPPLPVANQYHNSTIHNGYISTAFQQENSPQHQLPTANQYHNGDATYNNHHGSENGYTQQVPLTNETDYGLTSGAVENSYHQTRCEWENPATAEPSPNQNGYSFHHENGEQGAIQSVTEPAHHLNSENCPPISSLEVTIFYKGKQVLHQQVSKRCLLTFNPEEPYLGQVEAVRFPSPDGIADQKQLEYTKTLLDNVQRGVLLEVNSLERKLVATRLGKCKVFWAMSEELINVDTCPLKLLPRDTQTEIFDYNAFWSELRDFSRHLRESPDYALYMGFGQDLSKKPKEKKLILVKIVPRFCSFFHDLFLRQGASSLNSENVSLQISNSSSISLFDLLDSASFMDIDFAP